MSLKVVLFTNAFVFVSGDLFCLRSFGTPYLAKLGRTR
jgi:hypothetical protein